MKEFRNLKKEQFDIPELHSSVREYAIEKGNERKQKFHFVFKFRYIMALVFVALIALLIIDDNVKYAEYEEDFTAYQVENESNLKKIVSQSVKNSQRKTSFIDKLNNFSFGCSAKGEDSMPPQNEAANGSEANNQTENVDEIDVIKYEGNYIYYISNGEFKVFKVAMGKANEVFKYNLYALQKESIVQNEGIYLTDDSVCVIYYAYGYDANIKGEYNYTSITRLMIFDKETFEIKKNICFDGDYSNSRVYNGNLYLITTEKVDYEEPEYVCDDKEEKVEYNDVVYFNYAENTAYTYITTINLDTYEECVNVQLGNYRYDNIYMSENYLYLVSPKYNDKIEKVISTVYVYDVKKGNAEFFGGFSFDGMISNQWFMDEYEGRIRVAYFDNYAKSNVKINKVAVYDIDEENQKFTRVGFLDEGIGKPGQTIRSVLFEENIVNLVTYLTQDPLYCIQLVDGVTPVILSELEAPGYSQYLKSFELNGEKYLIGLGYTDGWQLKVSLYKSNGENIQIGKDFVIDGYDCEVFENSMSLFFMRTDTGVEYGFKSYIYGTGNDYYDTRYGYILLDINPNSSEPVSTIQLFSEKINRLVCIDGYYYAASIYGTLTGYEKVDGKLVVVEGNVTE